MNLYFETEVSDLAAELKRADGYLECEAVILANMKKHVDKDNSVITIQRYLKRLQNYLEDKTIINKGNNDCINYYYAVSFLNTVIATPNWHSWIKTAE